MFFELEKMASRVCAVVGAGPGLGQAIAVRFAKGGYKVAVLNRSEDSARSALDGIAAVGGQSLFVSTDASNRENVFASFKKVRETLGPIEVLVFNVGGHFSRKPILEATPEDFEKTFRIEVLGGLNCIQSVLPDMLHSEPGQAARGGHILLTGATAGVRGGAMMGQLATAKHGLHALGQSVAREHASKGVHVCHIRMDCAIDGPVVKQWMGDKYDPRTLGQPVQIAETYFQLAQQQPGGWTNEIDIRPATENWTC